MKKIIFIVLMIPFVFFSCGGKDSPKSLAKQAYDLSIQAFENALDSDKLAEIEKKTAALNSKIEALSASAREKYDAQLGKLSLKGIDGLIKSSGDALKQTSEKYSDKLNTIIESDEVQNALKELDSKTNKALDESKDTLRTFKNLKP